MNFDDESHAYGQIQCNLVWYKSYKYFLRLALDSGQREVCNGLRRFIVAFRL